MTEMKSPNAHAKKNRNDTPRKRKTHIIKVRVTAEEKLRIAYACKELHLTQSELVRRVLYGVNVKHTVALVSPEILPAVRLPFIAMCGFSKYRAIKPPAIPVSLNGVLLFASQIGRASWRERV